jgi:hypothetical protein
MALRTPAEGLEENPGVLARHLRVSDNVPAVSVNDELAVTDGAILRPVGARCLTVWAVDPCYTAARPARGGLFSRRCPRGT